MNAKLAMAFILAIFSLTAFHSHADEYAWSKAKGRRWYKGVTPKTLTQCRQFLYDRTVAQVKMLLKSRNRRKRYYARVWTRSKIEVFAHRNCALARRRSNTYVYFKDIRGSLFAVHRVRKRVGRRWRSFTKACFISKGVDNFGPSWQYRDQTHVYLQTFRGRKLYRFSGFDRRKKLARNLAEKYEFRSWRARKRRRNIRYRVQCLAPKLTFVRGGVRELLVIPKSHRRSRLAAVSLGHDKVLTLWPNGRKSPIKIRGVKEFKLHKCYRKRKAKRQFRNIIAFISTTNKSFYMVRGGRLNRISMPTDKKYYSLDSFSYRYRMGDCLD